jgi:hypothetical protein
MPTAEFPLQSPVRTEGFSSELKSSTSFHALHRAHPPASSSERPRSVSLPVGNSPLFPSPSSSFRPPPADEVSLDAGDAHPRN